MPLWKLQRVGDEVVEFLYPNAGNGKVIRLKPGVVYCLRAFYGIVKDFVDGAWLRFVRRLNNQSLGQVEDLSAFLFGSERASLDACRPVLMEVQDGRCFYCQKDLTATSEVDHFIPWSRYPVDLGHNFVLADRSCNNHKRDHLAAEDYLGAWSERVPKNWARV